VGLDLRIASQSFLLAVGHFICGGMAYR
jgi:hypothetical protein